MSLILQTQLKPTSAPSITSMPSALLQWQCACGGSPGFDSECAECRRKRAGLPPPLIQTKLTIGRPGDRYEQEADRVADAVMQMLSPTTLGTMTITRQPAVGVYLPISARKAALQRQPEASEPEEDAGAEEEDTEEEGEEEEGEEEEGGGAEIVQAKEMPGDVPAVGPTLDHLIDSLRGGGRPLPDSARAFFEPRFGYDFSQVRIHAGPQAAEAAHMVRARAFTIGRDIALAAGQDSLNTEQGRRLIAHELTHVLQQESVAGMTLSRVSSAYEFYEDEAAQTAQRVMSDRGLGREHKRSDIQISRAPTLIQRLGANPGCTPAQADTIHQSIFDARGWVNNALKKLETTPVPSNVTASLRRNFGPTYGVADNIPLIASRVRVAFGEMARIPYSCADATNATCAAAPCGYTPAAGGHSSVICSNATLTPGSNHIYQTGCVLHESFHSAFANFTVDEYSGWHGHSGSTPTYPGTGTDPLLNADSYTTLVIDLS